MLRYSKTNWNKNFHFETIEAIMFQTYMLAPCCNKWFECAECHDEHVSNHKFQFEPELRFTCKSCKKCFVRDFKLFSERDKKCDFCKKLWCLPAITPESKLFEECSYTFDELLKQLLNQDHDYFNDVNNPSS